MSPSGWIIGAVAALPWWLAAIVFRHRWRQSTSIATTPAEVRSPVPRLSIIVPARNEAANIRRCVGSILHSTYPSLDLLVIDDHSTDGTGDLARAEAAHDPRVRVIVPPPLPDGWFGKQWACWQGARRAAGEILLFTDADTAHGPEVHARMVRAMQDDSLDFLSLLTSQELGSFWERVVQPQVFATLFARYGGTEVINRSRRLVDKLANGQCLAMTRAAYDRLGGHEAVRNRAAEDLALAQAAFRAGMRSRLTMGEQHISVRMYTSLGGIFGGWTKNVFAAGRETIPLPPALRNLVTALILPIPPLLTLLPVVAVVAWALGVASIAVGVFGLMSGAALAYWFSLVHADLKLSRWYLLTAPVGAAVTLAIALVAIARGSRVRWKDRAYVADR